MTRRVYFIKPIGMDGPIKIGCSVAPDSRRATLETWSPFPLEIVAEIEGGYAIERRFHSLFADSYIRHEWFRWSTELQAVIGAINEGAFDTETLPEPIKASVFRAPRNNSYATPEWRYHASVCARFRHLSDYPYWSPRFKAIVGEAREWLPFKPQIEALIDNMRRERIAAERKAA